MRKDNISKILKKVVLVYCIVKTIKLQVKKKSFNSYKDYKEKHYSDIKLQ